MNSPRRPTSAKSSVSTGQSAARRPQSAQFYGVKRVGVSSRCSNDVLTSGDVRRPSPSPQRTANTIATQREVALSLRERLLNIERKKQFGEVALTRPRFQVSKRLDRMYFQEIASNGAEETAELEKQSKRSAVAIPAPPLPSSSSQAPAASKPLFQVRNSRRTILDSQIEAAQKRTIFHTEPFVASKPFAFLLRLDPGEVAEYFESELNDGYTKRLVNGGDDARPDLPNSLAEFFGSAAEFEGQDREALKEWKAKVLAAIQSKRH